jgi:lipopolysaccharide transport protein LptA
MRAGKSALRLAMLGTTLTLLPLLAAPAEARPEVKLSGKVRIIANSFSGSLSTILQAEGDVVLTASQGTLRANRVEVVPQEGKTSGSAVRVARATGNVRITSQAQPDQKLDARGSAGTFWPGTQKAELTGGVTVTLTSPQLKEPAVLTGARADLNLAQRTAEVIRTPSEPVSLRLQPKKDVSSPVRLEADRVRLESAANRVTATGSPVLSSDQGTVRGQKIWFAIDPQANDIQSVNAEGAVRVDAKDPQQGQFQATGREAVFTRADNTVVLTGNVEGTLTRPDEPEPQTFRGDELTYNLRTGAFRLGAAGERPARVTVKPKPRTGKSKTPKQP